MRLAALTGAFATGALGLGLGARVVHVPTRRIGFEFLQDISAGEKVPSAMLCRMCSSWVQCVRAPWIASGLCVRRCECCHERPAQRSHLFEGSLTMRCR